MNTYKTLQAFALLLLSLLAATSAVQAQTKPARTELATTADIKSAAPASILWVGNSFFYGGFKHEVRGI